MTHQEILGCPYAKPIECAICSAVCHLRAAQRERDEARAWADSMCKANVDAHAELHIARTGLEVAAEQVARHKAEAARLRGALDNCASRLEDYVRMFRGDTMSKRLALEARAALEGSK